VHTYVVLLEPSSVSSRLQRHARKSERRHSVRPRDATTSQYLICALTCRYNDGVGARSGLVCARRNRERRRPGPMMRARAAHPVAGARSCVDRYRLRDATSERGRRRRRRRRCRRRLRRWPSRVPFATTLYSLLHPLYVNITRLLLLWCILFIDSVYSVRGCWSQTVAATRLSIVQNIVLYIIERFPYFPLHDIVLMSWLEIVYLVLRSVLCTGRFYTQWRIRTNDADKLHNI